MLERYLSKAISSLVLIAFTTVLLLTGLIVVVLGVAFYLLESFNIPLQTSLLSGGALILIVAMVLLGGLKRRIRKKFTSGSEKEEPASTNELPIPADSENEDRYIISKSLPDFSKWIIHHRYKIIILCAVSLFILRSGKRNVPYSRNKAESHIKTVFLKAVALPIFYMVKGKLMSLLKEEFQKRTLANRRRLEHLNGIDPADKSGESQEHTDYPTALRASNY